MLDVYLSLNKLFLFPRLIGFYGRYLTLGAEVHDCESGILRNADPLGNSSVVEDSPHGGHLPGQEQPEGRVVGKRTGES